MELRQIKHASLVLMCTAATVAYIQLITMERWSRFWQMRSYPTDIIEREFDADRPFSTQDMNVVYFAADEKYTGDLDLLDVEQDLDPSDSFITNEFPQNYTDADEQEGGWETRTNVHKTSSKNKFAVLGLKRFIFNETNFQTKPLLLLFSSWEYTPEKELVRQTLLKTWKLWPSCFKALVMTKDKTVQAQAKKMGWLFQTISETNKECHGPPVLSTMFTDVFSKHNAYFYGYSNADIIYGDGLEKTMKYLYYYFRSWKTRPVLVVGRRHNVDFGENKNFTMDTPEQISDIAKDGNLVIRSTDYFFSNRHFPWGQAPKATIGKVWVVRIIIGWALKRGYVVIDATRTIQAVHLTTSDGVFASWHKEGAMCNERVLSAAHWSIPTAIGHCECARLETFHGADGAIRIRHRPPSRLICTRQPKPK